MTTNLCHLEHYRGATRAATLALRRLALAVVSLSALLALVPPLSSQTVSFTGAQTTMAENLAFTSSVAVDGAGNIFVAEPDNKTILKLGPDGTQTPVPVSGLQSPLGLAVDRAGDLFIADREANLVIKVAPDGTQTTVPFTGLQSPNDVVVDVAGNVFVVSDADYVLKISPAGVQTTVPTNGLLSPFGIAVDEASNVFVADTGNNRIVKISPNGTQTTVPISGLSGPNAVKVDAVGNLFIADSHNDRVLEVPAGGGAPISIASGLRLPQSVAVDAKGHVFIADSFNDRVVEVRPGPVDFGTVNVCPSGQTTPAPCSQMLTLNYDPSAPLTLSAVKVVTQGVSNLDFTLASGSTCTGTISDVCTVNVTFTPHAPGLRRGAVQLADASGNVLTTTYIHGLGVGSAMAFNPGNVTTLGQGIKEPAGIAVDAAGSVFVTDKSNNRLLKIATDGTQTLVPTSGLTSPEGVAVDGAGNIFVTDYNQVLEISPTGVQTTVPATGLVYPYGLAVDGEGNLFIVDGRNNDVLKISPSGTQTTVPTSGLSLPWGIAVDGAGNLFIADDYNSRIVKISPDGTQTTVPVNGLSFPHGVALDAAGTLFISDTGNERVVEVPSAGGSPTPLATGLNVPSYLALDVAGNLFISDYNNQRIVEVQRGQAPTLTFAATSVNSTSSPQSVTVQNIGNSMLSALAPGLMIGPNFAQSTGSGTPMDCSSTFSLTPGASCNLSLTFTPQTAGDLQSTAVLTDNALNGNPAQQTIVLKGSGIALSQSITFNALANQPQGTPVSLAATASSGLPVSFTSLTPAVCTVSGTTTTLLNPGTCTIQAMQSGNSMYAAAPPVSQSFTVTVRSQDQITALITLVQSFHLPKGTETSLNAKLQAALTALNTGQMVSACSTVSDFIHEVQAQSGKKLTVDQAKQLLTAAAALQSLLGCAS